MLKVYRSSKQVQRSGQVSGGRKKYATYIWMIAQVLSNLMCWLPFEAMMILSLSGYQLNHDMVLYFSIFILPLNSLSNPFLYTIRMIIK